LNMRGCKCGIVAAQYSPLGD